jgi:hypothetical protein
LRSAGGSRRSQAEEAVAVPGRAGHRLGDLIPKDEAQTPKEPLIIRISDPASLFKEVFRNFQSESPAK